MAGDVQVATDVDEVMDVDVDTVDTAPVESSPETEPEVMEELEGTDDFDTMELASVLAFTQQLTNSSDDMDVRYGARSGRCNLQQYHECDYSHLTLHHTMTQYHDNLGLKVFGEQG